MGLNLNPGDIYAILTAFCWSIAVILFQVSTKNLGSNEINLLKNTIGIIGFGLIILFTGDGFPDFTSRQYQVLIFSGALGIAGGDLLFLASLRRLGAGLSAIVSTVYSPAVVLVAFILFGEMISINGYIGGTLVITSIVIASYKIPEHKNIKDLGLGIIMGVGAQICTAISVLLVKPIMAVHPIVPVAFVRFGTSVIIGLLILVIVNGSSSLIKTFKRGFTSPAIVFGSIMGTIISVILWLAGFKYTLAGRAAIYNQLSTVLIILLAALFLSEKMTRRKWVAVGVAFIGALIVSSA